MPGASAEPFWDAVGRHKGAGLVIYVYLFLVLFGRAAVISALQYLRSIAASLKDITATLDQRSE